MAETIIAQRRVTLVDTIVSAASGGTIDFGVFPSDRFSRLIGIFSVVGSFTFRYQMQSVSGTARVSSTTVINSGSTILDVLQYGPFIGLGFTAVVSSAPYVFLAGEPIR